MRFRAVRDQQRVRSLLNQVPRGQVAHLPRPDQKNSLAGQRTENLAGKIGGHRCDRNCGGADPGFGADALGHGKSALQQGVQDRVEAGRGFDCAHLARNRKRLLYLAKNLRLADDHGVQ